MAVVKKLEKAEVLLRLKEWHLVPTEVHLRFAKVHLEATEVQLTPAEMPQVSTEACPYEGERADISTRPECRQDYHQLLHTDGKCRLDLPLMGGSPQEVMRTEHNDQVLLRGPLKNKTLCLQRWPGAHRGKSEAFGDATGVHKRCKRRGGMGYQYDSSAERPCRTENRG